MHIRKIKYEMSQTIQIKEYHPRSFSVSLSAYLADDDEDVIKAHSELKKIAEAMIKKDVQDTEEKIKEFKKHNEQNT